MLFIETKSFPTLSRDHNLKAPLTQKERSQNSKFTVSWTDAYTDFFKTSPDRMSVPATVLKASNQRTSHLRGIISI